MFVTILALAGCPGGRETTGLLIRDSAGIRIVEHGADATPPVEWSVSAEPLLRIGAAETDSLQHFQSIAAARRLASGRYAVIDGLESTLRYFDRDGRHLATSGREGNGPGELRDPYAMVPLAAETIAVADNGNHRLSIFDPSGAFVRSHRIGTVDGRLVSVLAPLGDSLLLGRLSIHEPLPDEGTVITSGLLVRLSDSATVIDTMMRHRAAEAFVLRQGRGVGLARNEFHAFGSAVASGDRIVYLWSKSPEVQIRSSRGTLEQLVRFADSDRRFTPKLREAWERQTVERLPTLESQRRFRQIWDERPTPDSLPAYSRLHTDDDGYIWLCRFALLERPSREWIVLEPDGELAASIHLPWRLRIMQIGDDYVVGAMRTALDVETLVVFGLDRRP